MVLNRSTKEPTHELKTSPTKLLLNGDPIDNIEKIEAHQLTEAALKLKALEIKKRNIEAQLATKKEGTRPGKQAS